MKKICMFLNGAISNDSRVIKTINSLSKKAQVDLFYVCGNESDKEIFNQNVYLYSFCKKNNIKNRFIRHSFFYNEFNFLAQEAIKKNKQYDIVYSNDLPTLKAGTNIKKTFNSKLVYDSHEIFVETLNQIYSDKLIWWKKAFLTAIVFFMKKLGKRAEKKLIKDVDVFITTSISFKKYFQTKYNLNAIQTVMNCPVKSDDTNKIDFRTKYNLNREDIILIFQGVLNKGRALEKLIAAMNYVENNIKLFVVGDGMLKKELEIQTMQLKLNNVFFVGQVPNNELLWYTRGADIGINLQEEINISKKLASANKLYEYSHAGIPIIASDVPENRLIINEYKNGVLVKNNINIIADAINNIAKQDLSKYQEQSIKVSKDYNWENEENKLLSIL